MQSGSFSGSGEQPAKIKGGVIGGSIIRGKVKVNDKIEAAIVIAQRTHHSEEILEVVAPVDIRSSLNLNDDDSVKLTLIPLHLVT